jgi:hypothetical protein
MQQPQKPDYQFLTGKDGSIFRADKTGGKVESVYGGQPDPGYKQLSPQEIAQRGLDPAKDYQVAPDGKVMPIGDSGVTVNNIGSKAETEFEKETAKSQAGMLADMAKDGLSAKADLGMIEQLGSLLQDKGGFSSGIMSIAADYGLDASGGEVQAAQALIKKLVPQQRPPGSGTMSDRDVDLFTGSLPSIWNLPGGNQIIQETMSGLANYRMQQGDIASRVMTGELPRSEGMKLLRQLPNPLESANKRIRELKKSAPKSDAKQQPIIIDGYTIEQVE